MKNKNLIVMSIAILLVGFGSAAAPAAALPSFRSSGSVYTNNNLSTGNSVLQYVTGAGGQLIQVGTFSTHGTGTGSALASQGAIALSQDGSWLITVDAGSNQITVFHVNQDGSLTFASITGSQGTEPVSVSVYGGLVYVLDAGTSSVAGNIAGFFLSWNGQLTSIPGSIQTVAGGVGSSPEQVGFNNDGHVLVVTEKAANLIDTFVVRNGVAGVAKSISSNSPGPYGFAFNDRGILVVSEAATGTLSTYSLSDSGTLAIISASVPDFGLAPCWVAISPDGSTVYASNAHGGTISSYRITGAGTLTLMDSVAGTASIPTLDLAFGSNGHILYALNDGQVTAFLTSPDGSLVTLTSAPATASSAGLAAI